jgi:hypothetical protein
MNELTSSRKSLVSGLQPMRRQTTERAAAAQAQIAALLTDQRAATQAPVRRVCWRWRL